MQLILMYKLHKVQSSADFSGAAKRLQRYTTREICNSIDGKVLITEFNVTYRYVYFSKSQKNLLAFEIDKKSCAEILQSYERPTKKKVTDQCNSNYSSDSETIEIFLKDFDPELS